MFKNVRNSSTFSKHRNFLKTLHYEHIFFNIIDLCFCSPYDKVLCQILYFILLLTFSKIFCSIFWCIANIYLLFFIHTKTSKLNHWRISFPFWLSLLYLITFNKPTIMILSKKTLSNRKDTSSVLIKNIPTHKIYGWKMHYFWQHKIIMTHIREKSLLVCVIDKDTGQIIVVFHIIDILLWIF